MKAWITGWLAVAAVVCAVMVIQISVGREQALPQATKQAKPQTQYIQAYTLPVCTDSNNKVIPCGEAKPPLPPMVAPTKRDVVTHSTELACPKGYEMGQLGLSEEKTIGSWWTFPVCVTPAFIAQLRKAAK